MKPTIDWRSTALLLGGIISLGYIVSKFDKGPIDLQSPVVTDAESTNETTFYSAFMSGCNENGKHFAYCDCAWTYLRERYTMDQIIDMGQEYNRSGTTTAEMDAASAACVEHY